MASSNQLGLGRKYLLKEADFHGMSVDIGLKWRDLARALDFNQACIEVIEEEKIHCAKECCIKVLVSWLRREGKKATAEKLAEVLDEIGLRNVADKIPYKPSDPNQNFVAEIRDLEEDARQKGRIKELEEVEARLRARIRELENEAVTFKATVIELENGRQQKGEEGRESHVGEILEKCKKELNILVTQPLQVPEVRQDNLLRPEVKVDVLQVVSERLEELYNITLGIAPEACQCSEALRERFYNFAYHTLQTEHKEMNHKHDDVKETLKRMSKDGKEEFKKLILFQKRRKDLLVKLEKLRPLFSSPKPPRRLTVPTGKKPEQSGNNEKRRETFPKRNRGRNDRRDEEKPLLPSDNEGEEDVEEPPK